MINKAVYFAKSLLNAIKKDMDLKPQKVAYGKKIFKFDKWYFK